MLDLVLHGFDVSFCLLFFVLNFVKLVHVQCLVNRYRLPILVSHSGQEQTRFRLVVEQLSHQFICQLQRSFQPYWAQPRSARLTLTESLVKILL